MLGRRTAQDINTLINTVKEGDIIELRKDAISIRGPIQFRDGESFIEFGRDKIDVWVYIRMGYELTLVAEFAYGVPDAPGLYASTDSDGKEVQYFQLWMNHDGGLEWSAMGNGSAMRHREMPFYYLPLRLVELAPKRRTE